MQKNLALVERTPLKQTLPFLNRFAVGRPIWGSMRRPAGAISETTLYPCCSIGGYGDEPQP